MATNNIIAGNSDNTFAEEEFVPYIPSEKVIPEFTFQAILLGVLLAVIFGVVMVYLGLKIGMTVSASIPAAVISMAILRGILRRGTILENNFVQTVASAGESAAAGVIFTIPALFIWSFDPNFKDQLSDITLGNIFFITLLGGLLGVFMMIPLRRFLIVTEHKTLPYPEGKACAEVLKAGDVGGAQAKLVFSGFGVAAIYRFLLGICRLWSERPGWLYKAMNLNLAFDASPALVGVGFIIGAEVSAYMLAGGLLSWFVLIPMITYFGQNLGQYVQPASMMIKDMGPDQIWTFYIRYIGAGAVAAGGLISLAKSSPVIIHSIKLGFIEVYEVFKGGGIEKKRTENDLSMPVVFLGALLIALLIAFAPMIPLGKISFMRLVAAIAVVIFGFFFTTVSSRVVGIVGSSSNPVSGMTIGTLLATALIFKIAGWSGIEGMITSLIVGALVCIAIAIAGDTSQDLKTGFLVGATPKYQQYGMFIGVAASAFFIALTLLFLCKTYSLGDPTVKQELIAPQANLMAIIIPGILEGHLPWALVFIGGFAAVIAELMGVPALPFAVGMYLPLELSTTIMLGGLVSWIIGKSFRDRNRIKPALDRGLLIASGLIAGDAIMGIIKAVLDSRSINLNELLQLPHIPYNWFGLGLIIIICLYLGYFSRKEPKVDIQTKDELLK
ncbi:MAG: oligopeptide transporter, OPT family [Candidatus Eremiobacteraeota bacterium]|nr:oligopeptide transporter, OPT family [Candidatus Eremiobacteraeota bacterium]